MEKKLKKSPKLIHIYVYLNIQNKKERHWVNKLYFYFTSEYFLKFGAMIINVQQTIFCLEFGNPLQILDKNLLSKNLFYLNSNLFWNR